MNEGNLGEENTRALRASVYASNLIEVSHYSRNRISVSSGKGLNLM